MLSKEEALLLLREVGCSPEVILHSDAVAEESLKIARRIIANGHQVDLKRVEIGALLHDIGRSRTHGIRHGIEGGQILREKGLEDFTGFAENHLGAGINAEEAMKIGLPKGDYLPASLEEKIVTYADNLLKSHEVMSYPEALNELREELGPKHPGVQRFEELHKEIQKLMKLSNAPV